MTIRWDADRPFKWQDFALCLETDPDVFFPEKGSSADPARSVCGECPVRLQCLDYALSRELAYGVFGGLTPRERQALVRRRVSRSRYAA